MMSDFKTQLVEVEKQIEKYISNKDVKFNKEDWLLELHNTYREKMLADNERIWRTGSIFIPISLALFAVYARVEDPQLTHVFLLGIPSTFLIFSWLVIADNHRAFQQKSEVWIIAIQKAVGLPDVIFPKIKKGWIDYVFTGKGRIQQMRWFLSFAVLIGWVCVLLHLYLSI